MTTHDEIKAALEVLGLDIGLVDIKQRTTLGTRKHVNLNDNCPVSNEDQRSINKIKVQDNNLNKSIE